MEGPLRLAICEDDASDAAALLKYIKGCDPLALCEVFHDAPSFLKAFWPGKFDLILLDIYMDGPKGLDVAAAIREGDGQVMIAFTTSSLELALEGYRLGVLKYLEKPITPEAVAETLTLARLKRGAKKSISLLAGGVQVEIRLDDILFFRMDAPTHAVWVHLYHHALRLSQSIRMEDIEGMVPSGPFLRCHRGYIVNLKRAIRFDGPDFVMENGEKAYVRLKDERRMKAAYYAYMFELTREQGP